MNSILVRRSNSEVPFKCKGHDHQNRGAHRHVADHVEEAGNVVDETFFHWNTQTRHRIENVAGDEHRIENAQSDE